MKLSQVHTMVQFFTHAKFRQDFSSPAAGRAAFVGPDKNTPHLCIEGHTYLEPFLTDPSNVACHRMKLPVNVACIKCHLFTKFQQISSGQF